MVLCIIRECELNLWKRVDSLPGWYTSNLSLATTADTKSGSAPLKKGTTRTRSRQL